MIMYRESAVKPAPALFPKKLDENKICQWYCCSCGQSYGNIIYKGDSTHKDINITNYHTLHDYLLENLKYYSQVVYGDGDDNLQFQYLGPKQQFQAQHLNVSHSSQSASPISDNPSLLPNHHIHRDLGTNYSYSTTTGSSGGPSLMVESPTRFVCHRCSHMMCPYCPKVRLRDLANTS